MDKEKELLEQYKVSLYTFEPDQWSGRGFYDAETRTIFLNCSLSPDERHRVLLHELGHLEHIGSIYRHSAMRCENEANRHMIHKLLEEELASSDDHQSFHEKGGGVRYVVCAFSGCDQTIRRRHRRRSPQF